MNKYIIIAFLVLTFMSCSETETGINGEWKLIEYYGDPGDGSGNFQAVDSNKMLTFYEDGTLEVKNGSLCDLGSETGEMEGTYDEATMDIFVSCSGSSPLGYRYEINADDELLLYYPCIEPCVEKYEKM